MYASKGKNSTADLFSDVQLSTLGKEIVICSKRDTTSITFSKTYTALRVLLEHVGNLRVRGGGYKTKFDYN